jgi:hypothetical protein
LKNKVNNIIINDSYIVDCLDEMTFLKALEMYEIKHTLKDGNQVIGLKGNVVFRLCNSQ